MEAHFPDYNENKAPAVLIEVIKHNKTRDLFNKWAAKRGRRIKWAEVSEGEMRELAKKMLKEAGVSPGNRKEYWELFEEYLKELKEKKANP